MATAPPIDFDPGARDAFAPRFPPGTIAPKEGPIALHTKPAAAGEPTSLREDGVPSDLGPNNERLEELKPRCVAALRQMIIEYRMEGIVRAGTRFAAFGKRGSSGRDCSMAGGTRTT